MRVEELRIGNWAEDIASYRFVKIDGIESNHDVIWVDYKNGSAQYDLNLLNLKPIKLTEEILLKCGFEIDCDEVYIDNVCLEYFNDGLFYSDFSSYRISKEPILYLHQLQNLFFVLSGKELEINGL